MIKQIAEIEKCGHTFSIHPMRFGNWKSLGYLAAIRYDQRDLAMSLPEKELNELLEEARSAIQHILH